MTMKFSIQAIAISLVVSTAVFTVPASAQGERVVITKSQAKKMILHAFNAGYKAALRRNGSAAASRNAYNRGYNDAMNRLANSGATVANWQARYPREVRHSGYTQARYNGEAYASYARYTGDAYARHNGDAYAAYARYNGDTYARHNGDAYAAYARYNGDAYARHNGDAYAAYARYNGDAYARYNGDAYARYIGDGYDDSRRDYNINPIGGLLNLIFAPLSTGSYLAVRDDRVAYCSARYRSFDQSSGTFLAYDGNRYTC